MDCNPEANIIIPPAFYVEDITKLADDNNYLRCGLWPILQGLVGSVDVHQQGSVLPNTKQAIGDTSQNVHAGGRSTLSTSEL